MRLFRSITVTLTTVALCGVAGCGGGAQEPAAQASAAVAAPTVDPVLAKDCERLLALRSRVASVLAGDLADAEGPEEFLDHYAGTAPKAIQADIVVIADTYGTIVRALRRAEPKPGRAADPAALKALETTVAGIDQSAVATANTNVTAWVTAHC